MSFCGHFLLIYLNRRNPFTLLKLWRVFGLCLNGENPQYDYLFLIWCSIAFVYLNNRLASFLNLQDHQATNIILNPGLAFGTGEHPTTKLCLMLLRDSIKGGEILLDYGTGSGILAIAALKVTVELLYNVYIFFWILWDQVGKEICKIISFSRDVWP